MMYVSYCQWCINYSLYLAFREEFRQALGGQEVLPDDWTTINMRETIGRVFGMSSGWKVDKETWWWNEEVQEYVQRKRLAKKNWDTEDCRVDRSTGRCSVR